MGIKKSSRHQKIIGNLGEMLICNWLSRSGFEVAVVDHTGLDLVAFQPSTGKRIGVTVKSRTRCMGTECVSVNLFANREERSDRKKLTQACRAFNCEPWIGVYVETTDSADVFLTSLSNYDSHYRQPDKKVDDWKMARRYIKLYRADPAVLHVHITFEMSRWGHGYQPAQGGQKGEHEES